MGGLVHARCAATTIAGTMTSDDESIAVVHLVHARNDGAAAWEFATSYRDHDAGVAHRLVLVLKAFGEGDLHSRANVDGRGGAFADLPHETLEVADAPTDLSTYQYCASALDSKYLCILNSYSVIRTAGWLAMLLRALCEGGFAAVAATGSYQSLRTDWTLAGIGPRPGSPLRLAVRRARDVYSFPRFPNPHLRTNGLLIPRNTALSLRWGPLRGKRDAFRLESGRQSITRQLLNDGGSVAVVGADGRAWRVDEWPQSRTFRIGDQANLLIADNRTRQFDDASDEQRYWLTRAAWGGP